MAQTDSVDNPFQVDSGWAMSGFEMSHHGGFGRKDATTTRTVDDVVIGTGVFVLVPTRSLSEEFDDFNTILGWKEKKDLHL